MLTNTKQGAFRFCSENTESALQLYCDCINQSKADLFIVMAQKAVCLFQYLLDEGMLNEDIAQRYVSSKSIDFDISNFIGKRVAIVDDIIISGSAIAVVAQKLVFNGLKEENLEIIALVKNREYQTMRFTTRNNGVNMLKCALEADDAECIEMSYDLSHILAYSGRQYDADFPVYEKFEVDEELCKELVRPLDWFIYDVTNDIQRAGSVTALVLFPKEEMLREVWSALGINLQEYMHVKFRMYFCDYASGKCMLQLVPMVLFYESTEKEIDFIFNNFANEEILAISSSKKWSYKAKMHFLQFYLADFMLKELVQKKIFSKIELSIHATYVNFGSICAEHIINCLGFTSRKNNIIQLSKEPIDSNLLEYTERFDCKTIENIDEIGYEINQALYQPIKWWYQKEELPVREKLKTLACHYYENFDIVSDCLKRLRCGFSFLALKSIVSDAEKRYVLDHLVSLFIDRAVDEGIVVPIIYHNEENKYICRAYRHGEDLPFGEADQSRLLYFLQKLDWYFRQDNGNKSEGIAEISFEKMIVLFYQLGLKKGRIFNRFLGFDNDRILQQRFAVHGVVATVNKTNTEEKKHHVYLSSEASNEGLYSTFMITRLLSDYPDRYIRLRKVKGRFNYFINTQNIDNYFANSKLNNISVEIKTSIDSIALMIEKWYWLESQFDGKDEFKSNISALTSCVDIYTYASSIATEIHYFKRYWEEEAITLLNEVKAGIQVKTFESSRFDQAMPSARKKHNWYIERRAEKAIGLVKKLFAENNLIDKSKEWDNIWRSTLTTELTGFNDLPELSRKAMKFAYFYSECYEWLCTKKFLLNPNEASKVVRRHYQNYCELEMPSDEFNCYAILDNTECKKSLVQRIICFINGIKEAINESEQIVQEIEGCLQGKVGTYTVIYNSVLVVETKLSNMNKANDFWRIVFGKLPEDENKTDINIIELGEIEQGYQKYGVFYRDSGIEAIKNLLNVYSIVHELGCRYACPTRAILVPVLPPKMRYFHNLRANIRGYADRFLGKFNVAISNICNVDNIHQFWLMKTQDVSPEMANLVNNQLCGKGYSFSPNTAECKYGQDTLEFDFYALGKKLDGLKSTISTVRIDVNGNPAGTGMMFFYKDEIYCISCQHLLKKCKGTANITAVGTQNQQPILLKALNYEDICLDVEKRTAKEEVLILRPDLTSHPYFDKDNFFCVEDCDANKITNNSEESYGLLGFGKSVYKIGHVVQNISALGEVVNGFYQMCCSGNSVEDGDSGAAIVSNQTQKLFGIHVRSKDGNKESIQETLSIPIKYVLEVLENINKSKVRKGKLST